MMRAFARGAAFFGTAAVSAALAAPMDRIAPGLFILGGLLIGFGVTGGWTDE